MSKRFGPADDITIRVVATDGTPLVARMFWPGDGDLASNLWGNRRVVFLEDKPFVTLYTPSTRPVDQRQDPCGNFFYTLSEKQIGLHLLKNGKLRLTPKRARNSDPKRYSRTLAPDQVALLFEFFAVAESHRAGRRALRRERVLSRWLMRKGAEARLAFHQRSRPSALSSSVATRGTW